MATKRADRSLIDLEQLKQVLDLTGLFVVILDREERVVYFNAQSQQATGIESKDLLNKSMSDVLITDTQRDAFLQRFKQAVSGQSVAFEGFWRCNEADKYICVNTTISVVNIESGDTPWVIVTGTDITEKKRTEQALRASEAQLRAIHDAVVDGIITIDEAGIILDLNNAAAEVFGYSLEELLGKHVSMLMPSPEREQHDQYISNYLNTGVAKIIGIGREVTGIRKDGTVFPHYLAVSEIESTDRSKKRMFTGIVHDLSEQKRIEQAAHLRLTEHAHASRLAALGEMASGIAHELNQPLAAIVSFADASKRLLSADAGKKELVEETLAQIAQQGERAGNIIRRLREFVRKGSVERQFVLINDVIKDILDMLGHDLRMQQITVTCEFAEELPSVSADKLQIEQVVLNLARNAIDALEHSATRALKFSTYSDENSIFVVVSDTGPGFNTQQAAQLFDAFYTTKSQGTGLGLSISHSIIAAHGGDLTADSNDSGATFRFSLPLK